MFVTSIFFQVKKRLYRIKILTLLLVLLLVTGAQGEPIKKNEVEDLNVIISQVVGGEPNVLLITDYSGSMLRSWGGGQVGNWDEEDNSGVIEDCEELFNCNSFTANSNAYSQCTRSAAHCMENIANLSVCGSKNHNGFGIVGTEADLISHIDCINNPPGGGGPALTTTQISMIYDQVCGNNNGTFGETINDCDNNGIQDNEYSQAAAAMDSLAGFTECASQHCIGGTSPGCDNTPGYNNVKTCVQTTQAININKAENCKVPGNPDCEGQPRYGSSRMDILHSVLFDFLDADDSLADKMCDDPNNFYDGTSSSVTCQEYMFTPFRNVRQIVRDDGNPSSNRSLPITGATDTKLANELTDADGDELGIRIRPLSYSGKDNWDGCTDPDTFRLAQGGFAGASESNLRNIWSFFRRERGEGGTPLAWVLGFDDSANSGNQGGNVINDDALGAFKVELQSDPSIECRPEFVIIITDGEDTCAGDPNGQSGQTTGGLTTDANRRSTIQAVSNLRTYYSRNPVQNQGNTYKKEVLVFVIGLGIEDPAARRTLNAMALAGGTHTEGIIQHTAPNGVEVPGSVDLDDPLIFPQGTEFDVFKNLGKVKDIDTAPATAQLQGCKNTASNRNENGQCQFQSVNIFNNTFFDAGTPFNDTDKQLKDFAFFVNSPSELLEALKDIAGQINTFSTSGVSPAAPQSSSAVALRDRIFLSILTPLSTERLWQGRLALYGFVDVPESVGNKEVIRKPPAGADLDDPAVVESLSIFDDDGTLNNNAKQFFWEAGKELAERDIVSSARNLYTVKSPDMIEEDGIEDPPFSGSDYDLTGNVVRYIGPLVPFNDSDEPINPGQFGIGNDEVTNPIPDYCIPPAGNPTDCEGSTGTVDCTDVTTTECRTCVKECMRDKIIEFLVGNTGIATVGDPMGSPSLDPTPAQVGGSEPFTSMGYNCPDPGDEDGDGDFGSLDTCSVRLGDIFHSDPVIVGSPSPLFFDTGYQEFAFEYKDRSAVVYVGANDGFLHAFHAGEFKDPNAEGAQAEDKTNPFTLKEEVFPFISAGTGFELFGVAMPTYLPDSIANPSSSANSPADIVFGTPLPPDYRTGDFSTFVLDNVSQRAFSDGSPLIGDFFIDGFPNGIEVKEGICEGPVTTADGEIDLCGREWHTILLAGSRNGGGAYVALDVTNPACGDNCGTSDFLHEHMENGADTLEYPKHLWTLFDRDFGNTWSSPSVGRIRMNIATGDEITPVVPVDRWVMFVGGGLDPLDTNPSDGVNFGNAFVVVDVSTGKEIFKFHPDRPIPSGGSALSNVDDMVCDVPSTVAAVDINSDGYMDLAYFGDTCGRMWRFDISMPIEVDGSISSSGPDGNLNIVAEDWTGGVAFCANTDAECFDAQSNPDVPQSNLEPIYFPPAVVLDDLGRRHVIFVTGDRRDPSNIEKSGKLYNFIDDYVPAFLAGGTAQGGLTIKTATTLVSAEQVIELELQSGVDGQFISSEGNNFNADQGEFLVLFPSNLSNPQEGEKGFGAPVVISRVLLFTTFAPALESEDPCTSGTGLGRIFALDFISGAAALSRIPGVKNSDVLKGTDAQQSVAAGSTVAYGMPTPAQLTFGARGSVLMSVAFTGGPVAGGSQFIVWELPPLPSKTQTLFWEELL